MITKQPEALRLADELVAPIGTQTTYSTAHQAAEELRRLHAENERLQRALNGAEIGSRANFVSMQQQAALKSEMEAQRDELLIAFKHIATQTGNMKFDAYRFSRSIIAKVKGEKQ